LIRPHGWAISPELTAIHGFTTEDCESAGVYIRIAMNMLSQFASRCNMIVAHNIDFDWEMINVESVRLGKPIRSIPCFSNLRQFCTMKSSEGICKIPGKYGKYKWPKLRETYSHLFGCEPEKQHDAVGDVETCMKCFFEIRKLNLQQPAKVSDLPIPRLDFKPVS
jgi:DNA polymerase-3 subunit epsilon